MDEPMPFGDVSFASGPAGPIAYQSFGSAGATPILLIAGLGAQLLYFRDGFCRLLEDAGFCPIRFDNRDAGLSVHCGSTVEGRAATLLRPRRVATYSLSAMAADAVAVLDALALEEAVVLGCSLGGAVAQLVAIEHPRRVSALVSVMSTPSLRVGRGTLAANLALVRRPPRSAAEAARKMRALYATIGSPGYPSDDAWLEAMGEAQFRRDPDPGGTRRQLAALLNAGDRRDALRGLEVPALVVHGESDPVFRIAAAHASVAAIPGARLVTYPGMGHDLPEALWPAIVAEITATARS